MIRFNEPDYVFNEKSYEIEDKLDREEKEVMKISQEI